MVDIQSSKDDRQVYLEQVGVSELKLPVELILEDKTFNTVATFSLSVCLEKESRGTHLSRFVEVIHSYPKLDPYDLKPLLEDIKSKLQAREAFVTMSFPYFMEKFAPVSKKRGLVDIECTFDACLLDDDFSYEMILAVPVTTLCPCSKEISKYGAHNQRCIVTVSIIPESLVHIEEIVKIVENNASSELYSILKREDEKFVTESAYDNPSFVEDVAKDIFNDLDANPSIGDFEISVESFESIHNHNAFAITGKKRGRQ